MKKIVILFILFPYLSFGQFTLSCKFVDQKDVPIDFIELVLMNADSNDVKTELGREAADIIYAVTNDKGKNRKERAGDKYYEGIRNTPGAVFLKLCDRIANVQYGKMTKSRMFEMYKKENDNFIVQLGWDDTNTHPYFEMFVYLTNLFND